MTRSRIGHLDRDTHQRYRDHRADAQSRLGWTDISNDEFVTLLLDVFALHCEREGLEPRPGEDARAERLVADGGTVTVENPELFDRTVRQLKGIADDLERLDDLNVSASTIHDCARDLEAATRREVDDAE